MTMWGGRPSELAWSYTTDESDRRLLVFDLRGSLAHARMLGETGSVSPEEADRMVDGLSRLLEEAETGAFEFESADEDVHSAVERRLGELVGASAGGLHTGRSRNDQVVLDLRLYLMASGAERRSQLHRLASTIADMAETHASTVVPSYTHLQQAQPTSLGHHLLAHAWAALRSADRFGDALNRISASPLGSGASSGSSFPLDSQAVAADLGMSGIIPNSLDAVGARDFVAEYVFAAAQSMADLSRLADEVVLWATSEFGWVTLSSDISTGSSALPQKRNPDVAELIRGRSASVFGDMTAILALQKGLPLAYNRDFQEDKRIVINADDILAASIEAMVEVLRGLTFHVPAPLPNTVALDLAEVLVARGVPFREAHRAVATLVERLREEGRDLGRADGDDLTGAHPRLDASDVSSLDPAGSLSRRRSPGAGHEESVREQVAEVRRRSAGRNLG
jgi:argininosuccinate lyase